jgi:hypothetical protein
MMPAPAWQRDASSIASLPESLDTVVMTQRLAPWVRGETGFRVVKAELVSHSPGRRAVIAYWTGGRGGDRPALIGKVYADPSRATRVHDVLGTLHALRTRDGGFAVPRPVALLPELAMSVQESVHGRTLDQLDDRDRRKGVVAAARWLAILHSLDFDVQRRVSLHSEARKMSQWAVLIAELHAPAGRAAMRLAAQLASRTGRLALKVNVPIHKDYHYQHVFVDGGDVTVIDLDEVRGGDPAFDVAHFSANLFLLGAREPRWEEDAARLTALFLASYSTWAAYAPDERHDFFYSYTCLKIAKQLVRGRGPTPVPTGRELERQVYVVLAEGLRCVTN